MYIVQFLSCKRKMHWEREVSTFIAHWRILSLHWLALQGMELSGRQIWFAFAEPPPRPTTFFSLTLVGDEEQNVFEIISIPPKINRTIPRRMTDKLVLTLKWLLDLTNISLVGAILIVWCIAYAIFRVLIWRKNIGLNVFVKTLKKIVKTIARAST